MEALFRSTFPSMACGANKGYESQTFMTRPLHQSPARTLNALLSSICHHADKWPVVDFGGCTIKQSLQDVELPPKKGA